MTNKITPKFTVKESATGQPWVAIEYSTKQSSFPQGIFGFELTNGISYENAQQMVSYLNQNLTGFN